MRVGVGEIGWDGESGVLGVLDHAAARRPPKDAGSSQPMKKSVLWTCEPSVEAADRIAEDGIELVPIRVVEAPEVTHIRYPVSGRAKLVLDDRGASGELVGRAEPER